jgi:hypothetical protein
MEKDQTLRYIRWVCFFSEKVNVKGVDSPLRGAFMLKEKGG